ncbi:hypothetical protein QTP70_014455 [Hemibagrus guttatus]|uniref:Uncharacterized protein n=1 Tax=Hemibagrus guttatus TaxID=175788 RepID=A0AAE0Q7T7_9TELE|nr:hypothetical protein QTP70_014455 [Hemibagrus guttatus]
MDLIGSLPKSARGDEYILVIVDYAIRFFEESASPWYNPIVVVPKADSILIYYLSQFISTINLTKGSPHPGHPTKDYFQHCQWPLAVPDSPV